MKLKISLLCYLIIFLFYKPYCQDKDVVAKNYYLKAEDAFNNDQFLHAYYLLNKASKSLGEENAKILDLKIRSAYNAIKADYDYQYFIELKKNIALFFKIADAKKYAEDKYFAILDINERIKSLEIIPPSSILVNNIITFNKKKASNDSAFFKNIKSIEIDYKVQSTISSSDYYDTGSSQQHKDYFLIDKSIRNDFFIKPGNVYISRSYVTDSGLIQKYSTITGVEQEKTYKLNKVENDSYNTILAQLKDPMLSLMTGYILLFPKSFSENLHFRCFSGKNNIELATDPDFSKDECRLEIYKFDRTTYDFVGLKDEYWKDGKIISYNEIESNDFNLIENNIRLPFHTVSTTESNKGKLIYNFLIGSIHFNIDHPNYFWY